MRRTDVRFCLLSFNICEITDCIEETEKMKNCVAQVFSARVSLDSSLAEKIKSLQPVSIKFTGSY